MSTKLVITICEMIILTHTKKSVFKKVFVKIFNAENHTF